jgi:hypothetical protein
MCSYAKKIMNITAMCLTFFPRQGIIQSQDYGLEPAITIRDSILPPSPLPVLKLFPVP